MYININILNKKDLSLHEIALLQVIKQNKTTDCSEFIEKNFTQILEHWLDRSFGLIDAGELNINDVFGDELSSYIVKHVEVNDKNYKNRIEKIIETVLSREDVNEQIAERFVDFYQEYFNGNDDACILHDLFSDILVTHKLSLVPRTKGGKK